MRRVIVTNIASLDGFFSAADGNPVVFNMDAAFNAYNLERIEAADVVLLGGASFGFFASYWPYIADAPDDPDNPALDDDNRGISRVYNRVPKVAVSDTLTVSDDHPWHDQTTVIGRSEVADVIARLRTEGDGDILIFASHVLWNAMLSDGLVDELHIMISPNTLGEGVPLFSSATQLTLLGVRQFEGSDNVVVRYAPAG